MGTVPNRYPVYVNEISSELGGENNLGYYRGRTYYNNGTPVTISANAAMSEFPNLSTTPPTPPLVNVQMYQFSLDAPNPNALIQIVYYPNSANVAVHYAQGVNLNYGPAPITAFNPALYHSYTFSYTLVAGCCVEYFGVAEGQGGDSGGRNILQWNFTQSSNVNIIATVSATPY